MSNQTQDKTSSGGHYAQVNGINLYYQIHGAGQPLVLLHGGLGAIEMFGEVLTMLAQNHQVIAVDLQAHGRTADVDRPLTYEAMADDVAALIQHLGIGQADVMGYSLGGGTALQVAIRHPEGVRKLVVVSTPFQRQGWYPEIQAGASSVSGEIAEMMKGTPMYQMYSAIAPRVEDWPVLLTKTGQLMGMEYDWSEGVAGLKMPVMIVIGDSDSIRPSHAVAFYELLGGGQRDADWDGSKMAVSRLAILPGLTHYSIFSSPLLPSTVIPFLDAPMPTAENAPTPYSWETAKETGEGFGNTPSASK